MGAEKSHTFYDSVLQSSAQPWRSQAGQNDGSDNNVYVPPAKIVVAHQDVIEYNDGWGRELYLTSKFIPRQERPKGPKTKKFSEYAILTKRKIGPDGRNVIGVDFEIQSRHLREKLKELITVDYGIDLTTDPIIIPRPYHMLFFEGQKIIDFARQFQVVISLEERKQAQQTAESSKEAGKEDEAKLEDQIQLAKEISLLADFIANDNDLMHTRTDFNQLEPQGMITFSLLWTIFQPGELVRVLTPEDGRLECMRLKSIKLAYDDKNIPFYLIVGFMTEFDGSRIGEVKKRVQLYHFSGTEAIAKLAVIPEKHWPNIEEEKAQLIARGKKWCKLLEMPQHLQYRNLCFRPHPKPKILSIDERVIIDPNAYYKEYVSDRPILEKYDENTKFSPWPSVQKYRKTDADVDADSASDVGYSRHSDSDTDGHYLRCPAVIPGFALKTKIWGHFMVDDESLEPIKWNKDAFKTLQMEEYKKRLIKSLINGHKEASSCFDDLVSGKGQGLIFLLHGPPGLGKTLTAETISEHTQRPLYVVSSGELTTSVMEMEHELSRIFKMGHRWDAVVLLDEADVLMSKRTSEALEKNAIVSVFLRCLEYYRGILFLTTNRVKDFDDAIMSRIHLLLQFDGLTPEMRKDIWRSLLQANSNNTELEKLAWTEEIYNFLGNFNINGRMIKNFLQTAALSAKAEKEALAPSHLVPIMRTNLGSTHANDENIKKALEELIMFLMKKKGVPGS